MIFGQSFSEMPLWKRWFAWYPTLLNDGRWAWMETIEYRHVDGRTPYIYRVPEYDVAALRDRGK